MNTARRLNCLKYNVILLKLGSLLMLENSSSIRKLMHYSWRVTLSCVLCFSFFSILIDVVHKRNHDFNDSIMNYTYLGANFFIFCRINYYYRFDRRTKVFLNAFNKTVKYQSETGLEEKSMTGLIKIAKWSSVTWFLLAFFIGEWLIISPVIFGGYAERTLPIPGWHPYNATVYPYYEITVFLQMFTQGAMSLLAPATDMFYVCTCLMIAKQFEILSWEIKNMFYTMLLHHNVDREMVMQFKDEHNDCLYQEDEGRDFRKSKRFTKVYALVDSAEFQNGLYEKLLELIRFHMSLLSLADVMENFFAPVMLMYFLPVTVVIMTFAYTITTANNAAVMIENGFAGGWLLFEVFSYCYFAEIISEKSEEVRTRLYDFPWYFCNKNFLRSFQIMHMRSSRPVRLTVGKFKYLDLHVFVWTIKTVYSFTTVLSRANQRTEDN